MKKIGALIIALALLAVALPVAADTTVGGEFQMFAATDFTTPMTSFRRVELNITGAVDDFNTVKLELDSEGGDFAGNVAVDDFRLVSDIGGALGLPVALTATFGYFDTYFTGWFYTDPWTGYYDWPNGLVSQGPTTDGAVQLDIGVGPATLHWYNDFSTTNMMVGADAAFAGAKVWVAYGAPFDDFGGGDVSLELQYAMDMGGMSLTIPAHFRMDLATGATFMSYMGGVKVGFGNIAVAAGVEGDDVDALDNINAELTASGLVPGLDLWVSLFMNMNSPNAFTAAVLEARYAIGAAKLILGYVVAGPDLTAVPIQDDFWSVADGAYLGVDIDY